MRANYDAPELMTRPTSGAIREALRRYRAALGWIAELEAASNHEDGGEYDIPVDEKWAARKDLVRLILAANGQDPDGPVSGPLGVMLDDGSAVVIGPHPEDPGSLPPVFWILPANSIATLKG